MSVILSKVHSSSPFGTKKVIWLSSSKFHRFYCYNKIKKIRISVYFSYPYHRDKSYSLTGDKRFNKTDCLNV